MKLKFISGVLCALVGAVFPAAPAGAVGDPAAWTSVATSPFSVPLVTTPTYAKLVDDPTSGQLLSYDGSADCGSAATSTWDGKTWTAHEPLNAPPVRIGATLGYDGASKRVVMFGGSSGCPGAGGSSGELTDTWTWNGSTWTQEHPAVSPPPAQTACAAWDAASNQFVMFGDWGSFSNHVYVPLPQTWTWTGTTWQQLSAASSPPGGPCSMTYDAVRQVLVLLVLDKFDTAAGSVETWTWDGSSWSRSQDLPPGEEVPIAFDDDLGAVVAYVGQTYCPPSSTVAYSGQCTQTDQTWLWDGSWSEAPAANNPTPGAGFAGGYDRATHQFVVIGGVQSFLGASNLSTLVYAVPGASHAKPSRVFGDNRQATAVAASKAEFPAEGSAAAVVLSRADVFADALSGGPLAAAKHAPLLLTSSGSLDDVTKAEITRVAPRGATVYLLGGTSALSDAVKSAITDLGDVPVRVSGADRFATAVAIADAMGDPGVVFEASGVNFPDALSAVPAAIAAKGAILLTDGSAQSSATSTYLTAHATTRYAVGGPAAWADPSAIALAGADRYATSNAVALTFFPDATGISVASGVAFPDALSGGVVAGVAGQPLLLTPSAGALPSPISAFVTTHARAITSVRAFGGAAAVSDGILGGLSSALASGS
jgi:putative cell wall-binding protein